MQINSNIKNIMRELSTSIIESFKAKWKKNITSIDKAAKCSVLKWRGQAKVFQWSCWQAEQISLSRIWKQTIVILFICCFYTGALFGGIAAIETACYIVGSLIFNPIYSHTVSIFRGYVYVVMAGMVFISLILLL